MFFKFWPCPLWAGLLFLHPEKVSNLPVMHPMVSRTLGMMLPQLSG